MCPAPCFGKYHLNLTKGRTFASHTTTSVSGGAIREECTKGKTPALTTTSKLKRRKESRTELIFVFGGVFICSVHPLGGECVCIFNGQAMAVHFVTSPFRAPLPLFPVSSFFKKSQKTGFYPRP